MDAITQINLRSLMDLSSGSPKISIGVIDGPVNVDHPDLSSSRIRGTRKSGIIACRKASSVACMHGTFIMGVLAAKRGGKAPGICPDCEIILYPIFNENSNGGIKSQKRTSDEFLIPSSTPEELSNAIIETINAGARIINLSLGLYSSSLIIYPQLQEAFDYALKNDVILVVAAGNYDIGSTSLLGHPWIIPVVACDKYSRVSAESNLSPSIGNRGLMAPGVGIIGTSSLEGQYTQLSGTSVATPFVSGSIALLWSLFPDASAAQMLYSIRNSHETSLRRTIVPPLLNAEAIWNNLKAIS